MDNLPKELHSVIISFLDAKSRRALRLASTHWFTMIDIRDFVLNFETEEECRQILHHLKRYSQPISVEFKSSIPDLPANHLIDEISQLTNVTKLHLRPLDIDSDVPLEDLLPLTKLANLRDEDFLDNYPPEILRHFSNLRKISMDTIEYAEQLYLTQFTQLEEVQFGYNSLPTSDPLLIIPHTKHITALTFEQTLGAMNEENLTRFSKLKALWISDRRQHYERVFTIPYLPYLENLGLNLAKCQIGSLSAVYSTLTSLRASANQYDTNSLAALTKLKSISLQFSDCSINLNQLTFWTALTNLERINIYGIQTDNWDEIQNWDWTQSLQYLSSTRVTSLILRVTCKLDPLLKVCGSLQNLVLHNIAPPQNQLKFFTNLTSLETLSATADMLPALETLTKLKRLELYQMTESDFGPDDILRLDNLKELENLTFMGNDDRFRIDLISWQHLPLKSLSLNWIDREVLASLLAITTLESLHVYNVSALDNDSIAMLTRLSNLNSLNMSRVAFDIHRTLLQSLKIKWCRIEWEDGKHEYIK